MYFAHYYQRICYVSDTGRRQQPQIRHIKSASVVIGGFNFYDFKSIEPTEPEEDSYSYPTSFGIALECALDFPIAKTVFIEGGIISWQNANYHNNGTTITLFLKPTKENYIWGAGTIPNGYRMLVRKKF